MRRDCIADSKAKATFRFLASPPRRSNSAASSARGCVAGGAPSKVVCRGACGLHPPPPAEISSLNGVRTGFLARPAEVN